MCQLMIPIKIITKTITNGNPAYQSILITLTNITYQEVSSFNSLVSVGQEETCRRSKESAFLLTILWTGVLICKRRSLVLTQKAAIALEPLTTHPNEWAEPSHK